MKASLAAARTATGVTELTERLARVEETLERIEAKLDAVLAALGVEEQSSEQPLGIPPGMRAKRGRKAVANDDTHSD